TDIGGGIFSLVVTAIFLRFWKPRKEWHFDKANGRRQPAGEADQPADAGRSPIAPTNPSKEEPPLTAWNVTVAWFPYVLMSILLLLTGLVRQREGLRNTINPQTGEKYGPAMIGPIETNYIVPIPWLDKQSVRDERLHEGEAGENKPESATFNFAWLTSPGSAVFAAALLSMALLRMNGRQIAWV